MHDSPQPTEQPIFDHPDIQHDDFFDEDSSDDTLYAQTRAAAPEAEPHGGKRRKWLIAVSILLLGAILGSLFLLWRGWFSHGAPYQQQKVTRGTLAFSVSAAGPVQGSLYNADFVAQGKIAAIEVSVGQEVTAGQELAKLDPASLLNGASQANEILTAPHAGRVAAINGAVGGTSITGNTINPHFIQLVDTSSLQVIANVSETDIAKVAVGNAVTFTVSAYATPQFRGTVTAIGPQGQTNSNVVTYPVTINVNMQSLQGAHLLSGMTANVTIITQQRNNVLLIPTSAVTLAQVAAKQQIISSEQVSHALTKARQQLANLQESSDTTLPKDRYKANLLTNDTPKPGYVLTLSKGQLTVTPVVLGATDGTSYEVIAGLVPNQSIVTGLQQGKNITSTEHQTKTG